MNKDSKRKKTHRKPPSYPQAPGRPVDGLNYLPSEAAAFLRTTPVVLAIARCTGKGAYATIPFFAAGRKILYSGRAILDFLEANTRTAKVA